MKVCFYLDNRDTSNIQYISPEYGNPGVGGTQYMIWSTSYFLSRKYKNLDIYIMAQCTSNIECNINKILVSNVHDAAKKSKELGADIFIFTNIEEDLELYSLIDDLKLKSIRWSHNFEETKIIKPLKESKYVIRNICVSKEQYDRLRDTSIFNKCNYIYNSLDCTIASKMIYNSYNKSNIICYVGAIKPFKKFHEVAKLFSEIEKEIPNIELHVIGSGALYNTKEKLGKYNIASEEYENQFIEYIVDKDGKLKDNVILHGVLKGEEKLKVMSQAKVGIANVPGVLETFCLVAAEFQMLGVPVIGWRAAGLLNSVKDCKTGFLCNNFIQMKENIIKLIEDKDLNNSISLEGPDFIRANFDFNIIGKEWNRILYEVYKGKENKIDLNLENKWYSLKWLRETNRLLKKIPLFHQMPSLMEYSTIIKNISK